MTQFTTLVQQLLDPAAYPEHPAHVEARETQISVVFLTGAYAYKIKKPLTFSFLDFTTLESRKIACEREVTLNRRLAPDVYLGVVPIARAAHGLRVGGGGEVVEYAVKMVQLPEEGMLDHLLQRGAANQDMVRRLAKDIAAFHKRAATGPEIARQGGLETTRQFVEGNLRDGEEFPGLHPDHEAWERTKSFSRAFMERRAPLFRKREAEGRIRDGHGDLHAAQVCFHDGRITILDCIEFNDRFRYGDAISDLAFMAMDLDFYGRPDLSHAFVQAYLDETQDWEGLELLPFYKAYRACVRGKVAGYRMRDPDAAEAVRREAEERGRRYYALAAEYSHSRVGPVLVLIGGLMGTGKTTLAETLAREQGFAHLSSDVTRKRLAGMEPQERRHVAFGADIYGPESTARTYQALLEEAAALLDQGRSVVVDASFREAGERQKFLTLARGKGVPFLFALCEAEDAVVRRRLTERVQQGAGASDGRWELYARQKATFQPPDDIPPESLLRLDTARPAESAVRDLLARLDRGIE